jgi:hypothetical protein
MLTDPFSLKSHSKLSPRRVAYTAKARALEFISRQNFATYALPAKVLPEVPADLGPVAWDDTSVTKEQMQHLVKALHGTECLGGVAIEVGSFRGVTTRCLASHTQRKVVSVDPFIGHGALASDYEMFKTNTADLPAFAHVRKTSGAAATSWDLGPASFIFIDAVHDYVNTRFDISVWWPLLMSGGIMAFHDTDDANFPGTRRAVFDLHTSGAQLYAHPDNITFLRK